MTRTALYAIFLLLAGGVAGAADFRPDQMGVATLDRAPGPHWVWVDDIAFFFMADGRAYLVDAGSGEFLGMLSTGSMFTKLDIPADRKVIYSAASYYPRVVRGQRQDFVTLYDPRTLDAIDEIEIPPKRLTSIPSPLNSAITNDQGFLLVYNMTPAQSVSVVDLGRKRLASEIITAGCSLVIPGERRFRMICGDGSLLDIQLDGEGREARRTRSAPFFDPQRDPVTEKPVRIGDEWLFVSFEGIAHPIDLSGDTPRPLPTWSLLDDADRAAGWRIGGMQHLFVHTATRQLYSLVHQGGPDTHKDPGTEVWVHDMDTHRRIRRIALKEPATTILVTQDDQPLLVTALIGVPAIEVYAAGNGAHQRTIGELGNTITLLQNY